KPLAHLANLVDEFRPPRQPVRSLSEGGYYLAGEVLVCVYDSRPRQRKAFPELRPSSLVVVAEVSERNDQTSGFPGRSEPHIDLVKPAHGSHEARRLDDSLSQLREIMEVIRRFVLVEAACASRRPGASVPFVDQDQVEVTVVRHLPAA